MKGGDGKTWTSTLGEKRKGKERMEWIGNADSAFYSLFSRERRKKKGDPPGMKFDGIRVCLAKGGGGKKRREEDRVQSHDTDGH